ncbi:MAG: glycosyltransferase [Acetobacteraceae bacterium]
MKFVLYAHSVASDWNNGHAHFMRGILTELEARGHRTLVLEPADGWSRSNLIADQGTEPLARFAATFPTLTVQTYGADFDHAAALADADAVVVHEWTPPDLVTRIGRLRAHGGRFKLLFHDSHHRGVTDEDAIQAMPLADYDGVLAFGETLRRRYERLGWGRRVFTWHEAADTRLFKPLRTEAPREDIVWIGNWGDGERTQELLDYLITPARDLGFTGTVHGVRYPPEALHHLERTELRYRGWIANADVPAAFARHCMTVHVPRRPYVDALPGIPTIRVFEALACGIPLVCAPWNDDEGLFRPGWDYLLARDPDEMRRHLDALAHDASLAASLADSGLRRIQERHTCAHRVDELLAILETIGARP